MTEHTITTYHCTKCLKFLFEHNSDISFNKERKLIILHEKNSNIAGNSNSRFYLYCKYCRGLVGKKGVNSRIFAQINANKVDKITTILHKNYL